MPSQITADFFNRPLSAEDMREAVIAPCGHSFAKEPIRLWLLEHKACPLCRAPLESIASLIPNLALREHASVPPLEEVGIECECLGVSLAPNGYAKRKPLGTMQTKDTTVRSKANVGHSNCGPPTEQPAASTRAPLSSQTTSPAGSDASSDEYEEVEEVTFVPCTPRTPLQLQNNNTSNTSPFLDVRFGDGEPSGNDERSPHRSLGPNPFATNSDDELDGNGYTGANTNHFGFGGSTGFGQPQISSYQLAKSTVTSSSIPTEQKMKAVITKLRVLKIKKRGKKEQQNCEDNIRQAGVFHAAPACTFSVSTDRPPATDCIFSSHQDRPPLSPVGLVPSAGAFPPVSVPGEAVSAANKEHGSDDHDVRQGAPDDSGLEGDDTLRVPNNSKDAEATPLSGLRMRVTLHNLSLKATLCPSTVVIPDTALTWRGLAEVPAIPPQRTVVIEVILPLKKEADDQHMGVGGDGGIPWDAAYTVEYRGHSRSYPFDASIFSRRLAAMRPAHSEVENFNIFLFGVAGCGKSSFVNKVWTLLEGSSVPNSALAPTGGGEKHVTKRLVAYKLAGTHIALWDTWGYYGNYNDDTLAYIFEGLLPSNWEMGGPPLRAMKAMPVGEGNKKDDGGVTAITEVSSTALVPLSGGLPNTSGKDGSNTRGITSFFGGGGSKKASAEEQQHAAAVAKLVAKAAPTAHTRRIHSVILMVSIDDLEDPKHCKLIGEKFHLFKEFCPILVVNKVDKPFLSENARGGSSWFSSPDWELLRYMAGTYLSTASFVAGAVGSALKDTSAAACSWVGSAATKAYTGYQENGWEGVSKAPIFDMSGHTASSTAGVARIENGNGSATSASSTVTVDDNSRPRLVAAGSAHPQSNLTTSQAHHSAASEAFDIVSRSEALSSVPFWANDSNFIAKEIKRIVSERCCVSPNSIFLNVNYVDQSSRNPLMDLQTLRIMEEALRRAAIFEERFGAPDVILPHEVRARPVKPGGDWKW